MPLRALPYRGRQSPHTSSIRLGHNSAKRVIETLGHVLSWRSKNPLKASGYRIMSQIAFPPFYFKLCVVPTFQGIACLHKHTYTHTHESWKVTVGPKKHLARRLHTNRPDGDWASILHGPVSGFCWFICYFSKVNWNAFRWICPLHLSTAFFYFTNSYSLSLVPPKQTQDKDLDPGGLFGEGSTEAVREWGNWGREERNGNKACVMGWTVSPKIRMLEP